MAEPTDTTKPETPVPAETPTGTPAEPAPETKPAATNREAKYRRELRETQAERDELRTTVETLRRSEAERLSGLAKPAALWAAGATLDDVLDENGNVDPDKVKVAADAAADALGAAPAARAPRPDHSQASGSAHRAEPSFADAFTPKR